MAHFPWGDFELKVLQLRRINSTLYRIQTCKYFKNPLGFVVVEDNISLNPLGLF